MWGADSCWRDGSRVGWPAASCSRRVGQPHPAGAQARDDRLFHNVPALKKRLDGGFYKRPAEPAALARIPQPAAAAAGCSRLRLDQRDGIRRGNQRNFSNDWAEAGCKGWSFRDVLPRSGGIEDWETPERAARRRRAIRHQAAGPTDRQKFIQAMGGHGRRRADRRLQRPAQESSRHAAERRPGAALQQLIRRLLDPRLQP